MKKNSTIVADMLLVSFVLTFVAAVVVAFATCGIDSLTPDEFVKIIGF